LADASVEGLLVGARVTGVASVVCVGATFGGDVRVEDVRVEDFRVVDPRVVDVRVVDARADDLCAGALRADAFFAPAFFVGLAVRSLFLAVFDEPVRLWAAAARPPPRAGRASLSSPRRASGPPAPRLARPLGGLVLFVLVSFFFALAM
jgi:hypothetical protein